MSFREFFEVFKRIGLLRLALREQGFLTDVLVDPAQTPEAFTTKVNELLPKLAPPEQRAVAYLVAALVSTTHHQGV